MGSRFRIETPSDFVLRRDFCSYGYFLLWPNGWEQATETLVRRLHLDNGPATLRIGQQSRGSTLEVVCDRRLLPAERRETAHQLSRMLRLDEDAATVRAFHRVDPRWKKSGRCRLMRSPTLFEDIIKTITSCNVTWPGTCTMNRRLCEVIGHAGAFPSARQLARVRPQKLRSQCSVGYRDARIVELARLFLDGERGRKGGIDAYWLEDPRTPDQAIHDCLIDLPGIGPYAAANIMQLLGRYSRLPLDTESLRHGRTVLRFTGTDRQVLSSVKAHFEPFGRHAFRSYWFELWTHYEAKNGPAWTWEARTPLTGV